MSSDQQVEVGVIKLKLMVNKVQNRVVYAEVDHEFMDILLSFLTLPLGTILNLLGEDAVHMGSINQIYASVSSLEPKHFRTPICKNMLLSPKNAAEVQCKKLKININPFPELAGIVYTCTCSKSLSIYEGSISESCGHRTYYSRAVVEEKSRSGNGAFVKGGSSTYMVTDELQIIPSSTANVIALFRKMGIDDCNDLEERTVAIGSDKVLQVLKFSLSSTSAFTNALLLEKGNIEPVKFEFKEAAKSEEETLAQNSSMTMKLLISKSTKRVLYAEAGVEVVDLLFSFLTFPLGAVIKLLGDSRLGCIDNLYKVAQESSTTINIKSDECKAMLISPKLAPHFSYENHPLQMNEYVQFVQFVQDGQIRFRVQTVEQGVTSTDAFGETSSFVMFLDPKIPTEETDHGKGYMKEPATFMITDILAVTPLSTIMCISQLNKLNISITDVEEHVVTIGKEEALNLLRASLISTSVLSDVFNGGGSVSTVDAKSKTTYGTRNR